MCVAFALCFLNLLNPHDWNSGLYEAVRNGNVDRVRFLLAVHPELLNAPEQYTKRPLTPLQIAAERDQLAVMKVLIELDVDLRTGGSGGTPLQLATHAKNREAAELLLAHGAVLDLYSAVSLDKRDEVEQFLRLAAVLGLEKWLANVRYDEFVWRSTPLLCVATSKGHTEMAKLLIRYGADPDAKVITRPCYISDINHKGVTVGLTPAGTNVPDFDLPMRKP